MRRFLFLISMCMLLLISRIGFAKADDAVTILDPAINLMIRQKLGIGKQDELTKNMCNRITELSNVAPADIDAIEKSYWSYDYSVGSLSDLIHLPNLRKLTLFYGGLETMDGIESCKLLRELDVSCYIPKGEYYKLAMIPWLESLSIQASHSVDLSFLPYMTNLKCFRLKGYSWLDRIDATHINCLGELEELCVTPDNEIRNLELSNFHKLKKLTLRGMNFEEALRTLNESGILAQIEELYLYGNQYYTISNNAVEVLSHANNLKKLELNNYVDGDVNLSMLSNCEDLRYFELRSNSKEEILKTMDGLDQIEYFCFHSNGGIEQELFECCGKLTGLKELVIDGLTGTIEIKAISNLDKLEKFEFTVREDYYLKDELDLDGIQEFKNLKVIVHERGATFTNKVQTIGTDIKFEEIKY